MGTGSVNVISFNTLNNAAETPSTAKSTPSQYGGRRLLQDSQPAENVVFAVTLPTASQNSLLVLQTSSATVRQQFAGWFVTQMAARGAQARLSFRQIPSILIIHLVACRKLLRLHFHEFDHSSQQTLDLPSMTSRA